MSVSYYGTQYQPSTPYVWQIMWFVIIFLHAIARRNVQRTTEKNLRLLLIWLSLHSKWWFWCYCKSTKCVSVNPTFFTIRNESRHSRQITEQTYRKSKRTLFSSSIISFNIATFIMFCMKTVFHCSLNDNAHINNTIRYRAWLLHAEAYSRAFSVPISNLWCTLQFRMQFIHFIQMVGA